MPNEIELKLRIAAVDVPRLRRHPAIKQYLVGKPVTRHLVSIYYDTPDLKLLDAAISLRVRRMSGGWFQAVKGAGHSLGGLHQRMEWEDIIAKGEPDFTKITEPFLARIFADQALRDALSPIFITDVQRTEWQLQYEDGSEVEVALDLGELQAGKKKEAIDEVELELKHGKAAHLFELALALQADIPLHIENVSKAQRGYAYYRTEPLAVSKAQTVALQAKTPARQAFQQIAWECLRQLQSNQEMTLHGDDPEGLHQMHIASRRLKVVLRLFKLEIAEWQDDLDWLGAELGAARDWDVLLQATLPAAFQQLTQSDELELLRKTAEQMQKRAYTKLRLALNSQRYQRLLLGLGAWLEANQEPGKRKTLKVAERALQKSHDQLQARGQNLSGLNPAQLHRVRIQAKRLRYAAEFFEPIFNTKKQSLKAKAFIKKLMRLQETLGLLNDIAVTENLLLRLARKQTDGDIHDAIQTISAWNAERGAGQIHKQMDKAWQAFLRATPFWQ